MKESVVCPICGTRFEIEDLYEPCPYCDFEYEGFTDYSDVADVKNGPLSPSYNEAKANFARGLTAYGAPLPKRKFLKNPDKKV